MAKYIAVSLDDDKSKSLAEVLTNSTCKKILNFLADHDEISEGDIVKTLKLPANTVNYNIKKLLDSSLVEMTDSHLWSRKGRKIRMYRLSNKSILISPKSRSKMNKLMTLGVTLGASLIAGLGIRFIFREEITPLEADLFKASESALSIGQAYVAETSAENISKLSVLADSLPIWGWFLLGSIFALIVVLILNWKKL